MDNHQPPQENVENSWETLKQSLDKVQIKTLPQTLSESAQQCQQNEKDHEIFQNSTERTTLKLKFNTSYDNLRCFISEKKTERQRYASNRLSKQAKSQICLYYQKHNLKLYKEEKNIEKYKSEAEVNDDTLIYQKQDNNDSDLSEVCLNSIVHYIEQNGIYYDWKDNHKIKSQDFHPQNNNLDQQIFDAFSSNRHKRVSFQQKIADISFIIQEQAHFENQQHANQGFDFCQHFENSSNYNSALENIYEKNSSFASTIQPYSNMYYQYPLYFGENDLLSNSGNGLLSMSSSIYHSCEFIIRPEGLGNDPRTTLMIKNIPNKYTIQYLSDEIDQGFGNFYDFLYLPCDTKSGANQGYGFINFIDLDALKRFYEKFHGKKWKRFKSEKICNLTYARLQGINSLIEHFQNSKVLNHKQKKYQPIIKCLSSIHHLIKQQQNNKDQ